MDSKLRRLSKFDLSESEIISIKLIVSDFNTSDEQCKTSSKTS